MTSIPASCCIRQREHFSRSVVFALTPRVLHFIGPGSMYSRARAMAEFSPRSMGRFLTARHRSHCREFSWNYEAKTYWLQECLSRTGRSTEVEKDSDLRGAFLPV